MLDSLITSEARVKLLLKFFVNPRAKAYLRELSDEFGCSSNAIRVELNRLVDHCLLMTERSGRNLYYTANQTHPLFPEIHSMARKMMGIDKLNQLIGEFDDIERAYLMGDMANGTNSDVVDLLLVGELNRDKVGGILTKVEDIIKKKIRTLFLTRQEFSKLEDWLENKGLFLIWGDAVIPNEG